MYRFARIKGVKVEIFPSNQFHTTQAAELVSYHKSVYDRVGSVNLSPIMDQAALETFASYRI